uniref:Hexamerin n=1 Tax=Thermobia domestica TaxID=89055 RepID=B3GW86_THEDO|nr:hexamerin precursor [Thermobia domestica]
MAQTLVLISTLLVAFVAATNIHHYNRRYDDRVAADNYHLNKQDVIIKLLHRVHQPNQYRDLADIGNNYNIEQNVDKYQNEEAVRKFVEQYKKGMLPRGRIFSIFDKKQQDEMINLFEVFYYAKDFDTFLKTACFARDRVNEGQFVHAFLTAILHREDTKDVVLPPIYEVMPHFFLDTKVIKKAYEAKMRQENALIKMNYTHNRQLKNEDQKVAYFSEDMGLNQFYSYYQMDHPFFYKKDYGTEEDRKGELFYYMHQQLLARYDLERLANDLPTIETLKLNKYVKRGYAPKLSYRQGEDFPLRPDNLQLKDLDYEKPEERLKVRDVNDYERRVRDAIDRGYIFTDENNQVPLNNDKGIDILGKIVGATHDENDKYYGNKYHGSIKTMTHKIVGRVTDPEDKYDQTPSVLEHYETSVRDPAFYSIHKRINRLFQKHKENLPQYTRQDIQEQGVKVVNVEVDKLMTYFEDYDVDLTNVVDATLKEGERQQFQQDQEVIIKARVKRINHKPFTVKVEVESDNNKNAMVRVFLGPKYNYLGQELSLEEKRQYMVELDRFPVQLTSGKNVIQRESKDFNSIVPDHIPTKNLKHMVKSAVEGEQTFYVQKGKRQCGLPEHLLLPKGKKAGLPFTLFIMVTENENNEQDNVNYKQPFILCGVKEGKYPDTKPMGYPFDRKFDERDIKSATNVYVKDVLIYHKRDVSESSDKYSQYDDLY